MSFNEILRSVVERTPGALGAVFVDWEGEAVDQFSEIPTTEIRLIGAHWSIVFLLTTKHLPDVGTVEEFWAECASGLVLMRRVTDRYYVVLATKKTAHLATARRELERGAVSLLGEM